MQAGSESSLGFPAGLRVMDSIATTIVTGLVTRYGPLAPTQWEKSSLLSKENVLLLMKLFEKTPDYKF